MTIVPGHSVGVAILPKCNWCEKMGEYDFKTYFGPWANGCENHWIVYREYPDTGVGKGQKLILLDQ